MLRVAGAATGSAAADEADPTIIEEVEEDTLSRTFRSVIVNL